MAQIFPPPEIPKSANRWGNMRHMWCHLWGSSGECVTPVLFPLFINGLPSTINNPCKLFADDLVVYCKIKSKADVATFQEDMKRLAVWETTWGVKFHLDKCEAVLITRKWKPIQTTSTLRGQQKIFKPRVEHITTVWRKPTKPLVSWKETWQVDQKRSGRLYTRPLSSHKHNIMVLFRTPAQRSWLTTLGWYSTGTLTLSWDGITPHPASVTWSTNWDGRSFKQGEWGWGWASCTRPFINI